MKKTVLYERGDIKLDEDTIVVNRKLSNPYFVISGRDRYSGTFSVNVTSPRWDTQSTEFAWMCKSYPCDCDLKDSKVDDKFLWVVTENNGSQVYDIHSCNDLDSSVL